MKAYHMERSATLGYANNPLNRMAELRDKPDVLAAMEGSAEARAIVLAGDITI